MSHCRLTKNAYPDAPSEMLKSMARDYFIDAIENISVRNVVYFREPSSLDEAVRLATKLQCGEEHREVKMGQNLIKSHEIDALQKAQTGIMDTIQDLKLSVRTVSNCVNNLTTVEKPSNPNQKFQCHNCRKWGHVRKECPLPRRRNRHSKKKSE